VGDGGGAPLPNLSATVTRVDDAVVVATGITDPDGRWLFSGLSESAEYFVTLTDGLGHGVVRGPWSGELREAWVRDRLAMPLGGVAALPPTTTVDGRLVALSDDTGNVLEWRSDGFYTAGATGLTQALADTLYEPLGSAYTKAESDGRYLQLTGGTLSGDLLPAVTESNYFGTSSLRWLIVYTANLNVLATASFGQMPTVGGLNLITAADAVNVTGDAMTGNLAVGTTDAYDLGTTALRWRTLWATSADFATAPVVGGSSLLTQTAGDARYALIGSGGGISQADADLRYVNIDGDTMTGGLTLSAGNLTLTAGIVSAGTRGNLIGALAPTGYASAMPDTDASIFLYRVSSANWAGLGVDNSGQVWLRTGLSGTPVPSLAIDATGHVFVQRGNLNIGATEAPWGSTRRAIQIGQSGTINGGIGVSLLVANDNSYHDGADARAVLAGPASRMVLYNGSVTLETAPSVAAGAIQTWASRAVISSTGMTSLTTTGATALVLRGGGANDNTQLRFTGNASAVEQWAIGNEVSTGGTGRNFDVYDLVSGANRLRINATGIVVGGATMAAWASTRRAIQIGSYGAVVGDSGTGSFIETSENTYNDGAVRAMTTGPSSRLRLLNGAISLDLAPSVAASAAQTFAPVLHAPATGVGIVVGASAMPAWSTNYRVAHLGTSGSLVGGVASNSTWLNDNTYFDGGNFRTITAAAGTMFQQSGGVYLFYTAPSVAAGAIQAFTSAMSIDVSGRVGIGGRGNATAVAQLDVQASTVGLYSMTVRPHASHTATFPFLRAVNAADSQVILGANNSGWVTDAIFAVAIGSYATKRIPVYNSSGTLQGYIPLYS